MNKLLPLFFLTSLMIDSCAPQSKNSYTSVNMTTGCMFPPCYTYSVRNDSLVVAEESEHQTVLTKKLSEAERLQFQEALTTYNLDSLPSEYWNERVDDGMQLFIKLNGPRKRKNIWVANYYLEEIVPLVSFFNRQVPDSLAIWYVKKEEGLDIDFTSLDHIHIKK